MGCPLARVCFTISTENIPNTLGISIRKNVTLAMNCLRKQWAYGWSANFLNGRTIVHTMRKR